MRLRPALLSPILVLALLSPARAQEDGARTEIRSFRVEHLGVKEANAILRSLLDLRKTAVDESHDVLLVGESPDRLDEVEKVLAMVDLPESRWTATIVAETAGGEPEEVRELQLVGPVSWASGGEPGLPADHVKVEVVPVESRARLVADVAVVVAAGGDMGAQLLKRRETQRVTLADGESMDLVRTSGPPEQAALQRLSGAARPVRALRLVVDREADPRPRRR